MPGRDAVVLLVQNLAGYRNLLLVVGVLYLCAFLLKPKETVALTPGVRSA